VALLAVAAAVMATAVVVAPPAAAAGPGVEFQMPFPCGEPWHGTTRPGHNHHFAVDFNSYEGEEWEHGHPVLASAAGVVLSSGFETFYDNFGYSGFGNYVLIDHGRGWTTFYAHLSHIDPAIGPGVPVATGTVLGGVGNTGSGSRNHLHYEQALDGVVQRATFGGETLPWGVDVRSGNCGSCGALAAFADVPVDTYYAPAVQWAAESSLTHGVGAGLFLPTAPTTRGQSATLLWRLAGKPAAPEDTGFVDVTSSAYYGSAVAWMSADGLSTGTRPDRFEPARFVSRAEIVTLLWRLEGRPVDLPPAAFADVPAGTYFAPAVAWAAAEGITTGVGDTGLFLPHWPVSRADILVFLHRHAGSPEVAIVPGPGCPSR
jgi:murein DD-endopeptidase MepM/ murein hydrolase activator NlpD